MLPCPFRGSTSSKQIVLVANLVTFLKFDIAQWICTHIICPPVLKGRNCVHVESALPKKLNLGQLASGTTSQYVTLLQRSIMEDPYLDKSEDQLLTTTFTLNGQTITIAVMLCTRLPHLLSITI